jgi:hypothetical protein
MQALFACGSMVFMIFRTWFCARRAQNQVPKKEKYRSAEG